MGVRGFSTRHIAGTWASAPRLAHHAFLLPLCIMCRVSKWRQAHAAHAPSNVRMPSLCELVRAHAGVPPPPPAGSAPHPYPHPTHPTWTPRMRTGVPICSARGGMQVAARSQIRDSVRGGQASAHLAPSCRKGKGGLAQQEAT